MSFLGVWQEEFWIVDEAMHQQEKSLFHEEITVLISLLEEPAVPALNKAVEEAFIVT